MYEKLLGKLPAKSPGRSVLFEPRAAQMHLCIYICARVIVNIMDPRGKKIL